MQQCYMIFGAWFFQWLIKPEPHYGGGIVINPELNHGLKGWTALGGAKVEHQESRVKWQINQNIESKN